MGSTMLIREQHTDLTPFAFPDIAIARTQWLDVLRHRLDKLNDSLSHSHSDVEYGGAVAYAVDIEPFEEAVDEARRMVCALGGEMRRRSESVITWEPIIAPVPGRAVSGGV